MPHWGTDSRTKLLSAACKDGLLSLAFMGHVLSRKPRAATLSCMAGAALLDLRLPLKVLFNVSPFPAPVNRIHDRVQSGRQRPERLKIELAVGASLLVLFVLEERTAALPEPG